MHGIAIRGQRGRNDLIRIGVGLRGDVSVQKHGVIGEAMPLCV